MLAGSIGCLWLGVPARKIDPFAEIGWPALASGRVHLGESQEKMAGITSAPEFENSRKRPCRPSLTASKSRVRQWCPQRDQLTDETNPASDTKGVNF